jgi:hypothetical protein
LSALVDCQALDDQLVADVLEGLVVEPELNKIASSSPISIQLSNRLTVSKLI